MSRYVYYVISAPEGLSRRWHSGGAAVVKARDAEEALNVLETYLNERGVRGDMGEVFERNDATVRRLDADIEIFKDAGCC